MHYVNFCNTLLGFFNVEDLTVLDFHSLVCFLLALVPPIGILQKYGSNVLNLGETVTRFLQVQVFYKVYIWMNLLGRKMNTFGFGKSFHLHIFASAGYWKQQQKKPDVPKYLTHWSICNHLPKNISLKIASIHQAAFSLFSSKFVVII